MLAFSMIQWWYTRGWKLSSAQLGSRFKNAADFFSLRLLVGNMFAPFRQISAGETTSSPSMWLSVFFDKLLSRVIGAVVRFLLLIIGIITIVIQAIGGILLVVLWPLIPFAIVGCVILTVMQVTFL